MPFNASIIIILDVLFFEKTKITSPERVLIIGDSVSADIQGGNLAGIKTCWYNPKGLESDSTKKDFIITDLLELEKIILGAVAI